MSRCFRRFTIVAVALCFSAMNALGVEISFDDGPGHLEQIEDYYAPQGVVFSNTLWSLNLGGAPGASSPFTIQAVDSGTPYVSVFDESHALVGTFSSPATEITITGLDVGRAGAMIKVYDAAVGGNLVDMDSFSGAGSGVGNFGDLHVAAAGILRFELFQPFDNPNDGDGLGFDNLRFTLALLPGDGNGDGWVDGLDYLLWAGKYGTHPGPDGEISDGDYNDDGWVNGLDYLLWAGEYGNHSANSVPEPTSALMLAINVCAWVVTTRRRRLA